MMSVEPANHRRLWIEVEDAFLVEHFGKMSYRQMSRKLGRTVSAISDRVYVLSLTSLPRFCAVCNTQLPPRKSHGRLALYCGDTHAKVAERARRKARRRERR